MRFRVEKQCIHWFQKLDTTQIYNELKSQNYTNNYD